jgi:hypothetical protein
MRKIPVAVVSVLALLASASSMAQDRGLLAPAMALGGEFWQARFERDLNSSASAQRAMTSLLPTASAQTVRLLGDYQFSRLRLGDTGGLRLTGGVLINLRAASSVSNSVIGVDNASALPYAGVGYASASQRGEWGFSADLGLAAQGLGSIRLDRLLNGSGGLGADGAIRLQPLIRLGMSLAF